MKRILTIASVAMLTLCGCSKISDLDKRVDDLETRVSALEELCLQINEQTQALQTLVQAQTESNLYIKSVEDVENGYKITFSNGKSYVIQDGEKGSKGDKGNPGEDAEAPVVSVRQDTDGGYYWTVNGEWMMVDGVKVSALGVTPQLRINGENWEISYDGGTTWKEVAPAYDKSHEITVTEDENAVYFKLADGTVMSVNKAIAYKFFVTETEGIAIVAGGTVEIPYTIADGDESVKFGVQASGYTAEVVPSSISAGVIKVTAPNPVPAGGYVIVTAVKNSTGDVKAQYLSFEEGVISVTTAAYPVGRSGGSIDVEVTTNLDYTVEIPADAQSWISVAPQTKAIRKDTVSLVIAQNYGEERSAIVKIVPSMGDVIEIAVTQEGTTQPVFKVDNTAPQVACSATSYTMKISANVDWTLTVPEGITASAMAGNGSADVVLSFAENKDAEKDVTYTITVATTSEDITDKTITVVLTQAKYASKYNFTYVRWGNNLGLDTKKYPAMYRVELGGEALKVAVLESDIPEGAPVSFKFTNHTNVSSKPMGCKIDSGSGTVTITPITAASQVIGAQEGCITVTVGGDDPEAVTKTFPFFVDQQGVNAQGYRVQADPFVFVVNPVTGGTSGVISCTKDGQPTEFFNIDFRRNMTYYNYYGPKANADGSTTYEDGRIDQKTTASYMYEFWNKYYTARSLSVNMGATNPISYWNNYATAGALDLTLGYIDPATKKMTIKAGAFVDAAGNSASGVLFGTSQYNVTEGTNPVSTSLGEIRPMIVYFDPSFSE